MDLVRKIARQAGHWLVYVIVRLLVMLIQTLRLETCESLAETLAWLASDVIRVRHRVVEENLRQAFPDSSSDERRRMARRMWKHLVLMVCEIAHAPRRIHRTNWHRFVSFSDKRTIVQYLLDPRPTAIVSGHFGNFEMGGFIMGLLGFPSYTVVRPLDNPFLDRYVNRFRSVTGQFILAKQGSAPQVQAVLAAGRVIGLLGDQHAGPKGCWVDFFGRPASCHKAIALFTLTSHAPMLVLTARRGCRPLEFEADLVGIADPDTDAPYLAGVPALTRWYNQRLEEAIRRAPDQYWWLHRRWKEPPPKRRAAAQRHAA
jgi:KDO2-lipid IV(A) lauroyltransferase